MTHKLDFQSVHSFPFAGVAEKNLRARDFSIFEVLTDGYPVLESQSWVLEWCGRVPRSCCCNRLPTHNYNICNYHSPDDLRYHVQSVQKLKSIMLGHTLLSRWVQKGSSFVCWTRNTHWVWQSEFRKHYMIFFGILWFLLLAWLLSIRYK